MDNKTDYEIARLRAQQILFATYKEEPENHNELMAEETAKCLLKMKEFEAVRIVNKLAKWSESKPKEPEIVDFVTALRLTKELEKIETEAKNFIKENNVNILS